MQTCDLSKALIDSHRNGLSSESIQKRPGIKPALIF